MKKLFRQFQQEFGNIRTSPHPLVVFYSSLDESKVNKVLSTNGVGAYFLSKNPENDTYVLEYKTKKNDMVTCESKTVLTEEQMKRLFNSLGSSKYQFPTESKSCFDTFKEINLKGRIMLWAMRSDILSSFRHTDSRYKTQKDHF
ncbi:MAG: hypothetical protein ACRCXC_06915 [Legionella sp.]